MHPRAPSPLPRSVDVGSNGEASFGSNVVTSYNPGPFPVSLLQVIAPFWVDVDMSSPDPVPEVPGSPQPNRLYLRALPAPAPEDVARLQAEVAGAFPALRPVFTPTTVAVFTWFAVGRYRQKVDSLNTFQVWGGRRGGEEEWEKGSTAPHRAPRCRPCWATTRRGGPSS